MSRELASAIAQMEARVRGLPSQQLDLSGMSDRQLELILECIDHRRGAWNLDAIRSLSAGDLEFLNAAVSDIEAQKRTAIGQSTGPTGDHRAESKMTSKGA